MAQANTYSFAHRVAGTKILHPGVLPITVTLTADTYATASGGVTVDISTQIAENDVANADVFDKFSGYTDTGHLAVFTKTATAGEYTVRLWNGTTEASDGATTAVIRALVPFSPGATA
jgi:hypothetical protein